MKMSTYLVAFIVGEFECTEAVNADGTPVRIFARPGKLNLAKFAEGIAAYRETGCADPQPKVSIETCRQNAHLYRAPASELERNLRGWDQYLTG